LIGCFDNVRPHAAKKVNEFLANNGTTRLPCRPYSPDLAPQDFFLFSYIKNQLMARSFDEADSAGQVVKEMEEAVIQ
jgi:hypothetical protein